MSQHHYPWKRGAPRTVFITGASSGIGRAMAQELAQRRREHGPVQPLRCARRADRAARRRSQPRTALCLLPRRRCPAQQHRNRRAPGGARELGAPDLAIHSAGVLHNGPLLQSSAADFEQVIDVNLKGTRHFAAAVLAHMQPGSQIAFIASLAALTGNFGYTAYCASKYGVRGLAEALRYEMKLQGIDVSLCCPGEIMTPMVVAEKRAMHPVSAAMKAFAGSSTLDVSVPALLRGIARREFEITDTPKAALTAWLSRHTPQLARAVGDAIARRAQAQLSKGTP
ncbi:SDR family NAD(P)-dependent oxidoreductase [Melaminivora sp.]